MLSPSFWSSQNSAVVPHSDGARVTVDILPTELQLKIVSLAIYAEMPTKDRIHNMTVLPLVCRKWRSLYADLTSLDIVLPCLSHLFYLLRIMRVDHRPPGTIPSHIYRDIDLGSRARSLSCQVDLCSDNRDPALSSYSAISQLSPNLSLLQSCFPNVNSVSLEMKFRFLGAKNPNWAEKVFHASVDIPLRPIATTTTTSEKSDAHTVHYSLLVDDPNIATVSEELLRQDVWDIYLALGGPRTSNLQSQHALVPSAVTTFPFAGISELQVHPPKDSGSLSLMTFSTRSWDCPAPGGRILESMLRVTYGCNPYHTPSCASPACSPESSSLKSMVFNCWTCSCFLWLTQVMLRVMEVDKLSSYQRRRGNFFYQYIL